MGKVKFLRGVESHYNATTHQDGVYFTTDDDNVNSIIMNGRKYGVPYVETTYSALKGLRDGGYLTPGAWYRITDYVTTTTQADTQSANHPFDVIVLATSTNTLSEEARAIQHSGDTYFANSNLSAWKIWYKLDNVYWSPASSTTLYNCNLAFGGDTMNNVAAQRIPSGDTQVDGVNYYYWHISNGTNLYLTSNTLSDGNYDVYYPAGTLLGTGTVTINSITTTPTGTGTIYRMIDEFNNDIPYDFKNIQFGRTLTNGEYNASGTDTWCYTLNYWNSTNNTCQDASIIGNTLQNNEGTITGVYGNKMGIYLQNNSFILNDIVFLTIGSNNNYDGCNSNTFGNQCYSNTFGNGCNSNTFGDNCYSNIFGNYCYRNIFGNGCYLNKFGNDCKQNIFGNSATQNRFGNGCINNTFMNDSGSHTFGNYCQNNTLKNGCGLITFGNYCSYNTFGNYCTSNSFGDYCQENIFGNGFFTNTFGSYCKSNTFGNDCHYIIFGTGKYSTKSYVRYIRVENGVGYVNITTTASTNSNNYLQNLIIYSGIVGTDSTRKTITHPTTGDTIQTIYKPANSQVITV